MTAADPRDLETAFGTLWLSDAGRPVIESGRTEAELRRNLASFAHAYGWAVQEEVVVPGWGRIDLILRDGPGAPLLVELKLDLTRPAQIRRAFQQTDGYGRWWTREYGEPVDTVLAAVKLDLAGMSSVHRAYPHVGWRTIAGLLGLFISRGTDDGLVQRRRRCSSRLDSLQRLASVYEVALGDLPPDPQSEAIKALNAMLDSARLFARDGAE